MPTFIRIPGVNPDMERPAALSVDPVMAQRGALMLVDLTHPLYSRLAGVPAHGATVPNHAWEQAAEMAGGNRAGLAAVVDTVGMSGTKGKVERTGKGGIHAIFSQVNNTAPADRTHFNLVLPAPIRAYLDANPDNNIFLSLWGRSTRRSTAAAGQVVSVAGIDAGTTAFRVYLGENTRSEPQPGHGTFLGARGDANTPAGPYIKNAGAAGSVGGFRIGESAPAERGRLWGIGNTGFLNTYAAGSQPAPQGHAGSHILYRAYLEDLTVSGRTYAQVDALDFGYYTEECMTSGGRYYGDSFTSPETLI